MRPLLWRRHINNQVVKWRERVGEAGVEKLLSETINTAKREGLLPEKLCRRVHVDTTVQEKAITFPNRNY